MCPRPEGGHIGPPLQKKNYLFDRSLVSELRIDYGPGYRVYFIQRGQTLVILLAGGDKRTQDQDIKTAREMARKL